MAWTLSLTTRPPLFSCLLRWHRWENSQWLWINLWWTVQILSAFRDPEEKWVFSNSSEFWWCLWIQLLLCSLTAVSQRQVQVVTPVHEFCLFALCSGWLCFPLLLREFGGPPNTSLKLCFLSAGSCIPGKADSGWARLGFPAVPNLLFLPNQR